MKNLKHKNPLLSLKVDSDLLEIKESFLARLLSPFAGQAHIELPLNVIASYKEEYGFPFYKFVSLYIYERKADGRVKVLKLSKAINADFMNRKSYITLKEILSRNSNDMKTLIQGLEESIQRSVKS